ncbi:MAG: A/G-specific adenine glycosylase [Phycisphaerae bacterium]
MAQADQNFGPVRRKLLDWFASAQRDLPWRRSRDPYRVWISEILLQQTRVEAVRETYSDFLDRFPNVAALARADLDDVLKAWEGMGYYSRARNLHKAAKMVVEQFDGQLPETVDQLRKLSGIGPYTAGAIASIAFGHDEPVLDGNVKRVLSRLFAIEDDPDATATKKHLWDLARRLIPAGKAGTFNEAIMDLGAMICIPRSPRCTACPLTRHCHAFQLGKQNQLPVRKTKKPVPHHDIAVGIVWKSGKILIDQRPPDGLLGGLWEFPGGKIEKGESQTEAVSRELREEVGIEVDVGEKLIAVDHAYTHFKITLHVYRCTHKSGRPRPIACQRVKWVTLDELDDYAFPTANRRIIARLREVSES